MRFTIVMLALLVACGGGNKVADEPASEGAPLGADPEGAAAVDDSSASPKVSEEAATRTPVDTAMKLFEDMVEVVSKAPNCDQLATDLSAWADATAEQRTKVNEQLTASGEIEQVQQKVMERQDLLQTLQNAVAPCQDNPAVMEAFQKASGA